MTFGHPPDSEKVIEIPFFGVGLFAVKLPKVSPPSYHFVGGFGNKGTIAASPLFIGF
jgi:hypothetical protein